MLYCSFFTLRFPIFFGWFFSLFYRLFSDWYYWIFNTVFDYFSALFFLCITLYFEFRSWLFYFLLVFFTCILLLFICVFTLLLANIHAVNDCCTYVVARLNSERCSFFFLFLSASPCFSLRDLLRMESIFLAVFLFFL